MVPWRTAETCSHSVLTYRRSGTSSSLSVDTSRIRWTSASACWRPRTQAWPPSATKRTHTRRRSPHSCSSSSSTSSRRASGRAARPRSPRTSRSAIWANGSARSWRSPRTRPPRSARTPRTASRRSGPRPNASGATRESSTTRRSGISRRYWPGGAPRRTGRPPTVGPDWRPRSPRRRSTPTGCAARPTRHSTGPRTRRPGWSATRPRRRSRSGPRSTRTSRTSG